ncbi:hypothetical protein XENTR_v10001362 [Xenopus tropicalis]|nr:hypothetical protein XENTR_v10001362 [Xenopus tropicalis]
MEIDLGCEENAIHDRLLDGSCAPSYRSRKGKYITNLRHVKYPKTSDTHCMFSTGIVKKKADLLLSVLCCKCTDRYH